MGHSRWKKFISLIFGIWSTVLFFGFVLFIGTNLDVVQAANIPIFDPLLQIGLLSFLATLLTYQRPENKISWFVFLMAIMRQTGVGHTTVAVLVAQGTEPTFWLTWIGFLWPLLTGLMYAILAYIMVLFPTGRLLSARWHPLTGIVFLLALLDGGVILYVSYDLYAVFSQAAVNQVDIVLRPLAQSGPWVIAKHVRTITELSFVSFGFFIGILIILICSMFSLRKRFRQGNHLEQQQIKWVLFAVAIWAGALVLVFSPLNIPIQMLYFVSPLPLLAIALAILRYKLFDIDLIIRRTLIYTLLSVILAGVYFGMVAFLQRLFSLLSGGTSPVIIVISTLAIVILFAPLRRRIQDLIDRRFYRKKYDAEQILSAFAETTRDEVDLDALHMELLRVVQETMQPEQISIWLKEK